MIFYFVSTLSSVGGVVCSAIVSDVKDVCGASKGFLKDLKTFIKSFEAP